MRTRLDGMGPVNMMALEEYNEIAQRHAFLEAQADRPVLVLGTHFAEPVGGRIVRDGESYRLA